MLINKNTLINMVMYLRRKMNMPVDECWKTFIFSAEVEEISEVWEGLNELWNINQRVGRINFGYCLA